MHDCRHEYITPFCRRAVAALLTAALLLAACSRGALVRHDANTLVIGVLEEPDRLDPLLANLFEDNNVFALVFNGLVKFDRRGAIVPDLATAVPTRANGGISVDGKTLTYHLRRGIRWQDGAPFTSADVLFTWRALVDPRNIVPAHGPYDHIVAIETPDMWTVRVRLRAPFAPALTLFAGDKQGAIVPAHLLEGVRDLGRSNFETAPIGTGPYRVTAWHRGDSIELERSPFASPRPAFARIRIALFSNEQALVNAVRTGEVDVALDLTESSAALLSNDLRVRVRSTPTYQFEHLTFNLRQGSGPQTDALVRRAFSEAIDVKGYARVVFRGRAGLAPLDQAPWSWALDSNVRFLPYDPVRARHELLRAGYHLPIALTIVSTAGNDARSRLEVLMQSHAARAGIALAIKNLPANLMLARAEDGGILSGGRFEIALFTFAATSPDPDDERYLASSAIPPNGINMGAYNDPAVDRLERQAVSTYDLRTRATLYAKIQRTLIEGLPLYTLAWTPSTVVSRRGITGVEPVPVGSALAGIAAVRE